MCINQAMEVVIGEGLGVLSGSRMRKIGGVTWVNQAVEWLEAEDRRCLMRPTSKISEKVGVGVL